MVADIVVLWALGQEGDHRYMDQFGPHFSGRLRLLKHTCLPSMAPIVPRGTAASWVDLHPTGASESRAWAVSGGRQVGWATFGGNYHVSLWSGTAASRVDLHALLPGDYTLSCAKGIEVSGEDIWVTGYAYNSPLNGDEAMLWHYVIPDPSSLLALAFGLPVLAFALRRRSR